MSRLPVCGHRARGCRSAAPDTARDRYRFLRDDISKRLRPCEADQMLPCGSGDLRYMVRLAFKPAAGNHRHRYEIVPCMRLLRLVCIEPTVPEITQTPILTRTAMKSAMPDGRRNHGRTGATLAIHLSIRTFGRLSVTDPIYGADCPVIVAYRVGLPDEAYIHGTLSTNRARRKRNNKDSAIFIWSAQTEDFRDSVCRCGSCSCAAASGAASQMTNHPSWWCRSWRRHRYGRS